MKKICFRHVPKSAKKKFGSKSDFERLNGGMSHAMRSQVMKKMSQAMNMHA